jgi:UDP-N-acetylmuramoylalanine--D-glutamate ligase
MAASLAALLAGAPVEAVREGLRSFEAMPHRLQLVADTHGIKWIDDSKASNPDAVVKALQSFDAPIVLIAGGRSKKTDFAEMAKVASQRAKLVVLIGESAREIAALIHQTPSVFAESMPAAVAAAAETAARGDVVLLSPGCASFDMFESAEQRGDAFAAAVAQRINAGASR